MGRNSVSRLVKDIILAGIAWAICTWLIASFGEANGSLDATQAKFFGLFFAGIPFGWRWASKIISAVSMKGVFIKLGMAVILGWFAIFVVLIGDIIRCTMDLCGKTPKRKRPTSRTGTARHYEEIDV